MKHLVLIDLSAIFWANWHATKDLDVSEAFALTVGRVHQLSGDGLCAVCCDAPPYTHRKALLPTYKAQREAAPPAAIGQLKRVKERLIADGFVLWDVPGYESDDVIATACKLARAEEQPLSVTIVSGDKDLAQLVDDTAQIDWLSPSDGTRRDAKGVSEKFGVPPQLMLDFLALQGDKSDNIPGIPGVGAINAAKLIAQYGDLEGVLAGAEEIKQPKLRENLLANADKARLAAKVIALSTDVPLDFDAVFAERKPKPIAPRVSPAALDAAGDDEEQPSSQRRYTEGTDDELLDEVMPSAPAPEPVPPAPSPETHQRAELAITPAKPASQIVRAPASFEMSLQPRSLGQVVELARGIVNSRLYTKFDNEDAVVAVILRGREMGLSMMQSLDCFHVVEGRPTLSAHLIIERAQNHPSVEWFRFLRGDSTYAEWQCKKRGLPPCEPFRYTIEDAQRAGLCPTEPRPQPVWKEGRNGRKYDCRGQWEKRPAEMLRKTAGVQLARAEVPGAALGLYATEEMAPDYGFEGAA